MKIHPDTGRPNLNIGRHAHDIEGMDPDDSVALLDRLNDEALNGSMQTFFGQFRACQASLR